MKATQIVENLSNLISMQRREEDFFEGNKRNMLRPKVAIAIAKNIESLRKEYQLIVKLEEKNLSIAKEKDITMKDLPEQKELLELEFDIDIKMVSEKDIESCEVSTSDVMALMFMTEIKKDSE